VGAALRVAVEAEEVVARCDDDAAAAERDGVAGWVGGWVGERVILGAILGEQKKSDKIVWLTA
jgi:hypothetical protein